MCKNFFAHRHIKCLEHFHRLKNNHIHKHEEDSKSIPITIQSIFISHLD